MENRQLQLIFGLRIKYSMDVEFILWKETNLDGRFPHSPVLQSPSSTLLTIEKISILVTN